MEHKKLIKRLIQIIVTCITFFLFICTHHEFDDDSLPINSNPKNNKIAPKAEAGPDTTVVINNPIHLHGTGIEVDSAIGFIKKYEWKFGNSDWVVTSSGDTTITAPSTAQSYVCSLRVTDDNGLTGVDKVMITVTYSDSVGPIIKLVTPKKDGAKVSESSLSVTVYCTDPSEIASVTCIYNGKVLLAAKTADNSYSIGITGLAVGENTLSFTATDGSTNENKTIKNFTIVYDPKMIDKDSIGLDGGITNCCGDLGSLDTKGLIVYYPLDNLPDTIPVGMLIKDLSGRGNDAKFKRMESDNPADSGKVYSSIKDKGIIGDALHIAKWDYIAILDGTTNRDFDFGTGDFTWSMWVKPTENGIHNDYLNQIWFGAQQSEDGCGGGTFMWLGIHASTDLVIWQLRAAHKDSITIQKGYQHLALNTEGLANDWHHIIAVKDGHRHSNISIYIDGKEVDQYIAQENMIEGTISSEEKVIMDEDYEFSKIDYFYIGMFPVCHGYASTFTMDEVSIWKRPLSKDEVEMLYKKQSSKFNR